MSMRIACFRFLNASLDENTRVLEQFRGFRPAPPRGPHCRCEHQRVRIAKTPQIMLDLFGGDPVGSDHAIPQLTNGGANKLRYGRPSTAIESRASAPMSVKPSERSRA